MGTLQQVLVDCSAPPGTPATVVALTADEVTAYTAQQVLGQAQTQAQQAVQAVRDQHTTALGQLKPTLTGNATTTANDITAVQNLIASIEAGTQPTQAQVLQTLRFLLRALAVLHG